MRSKDTFGGMTLHTYDFRDRECWLGAEVGRELKYGRNGHDLNSLVHRARRRRELKEGEDFDILTGEAFRAFRALGHGVPKGAVRATILYRSGLAFVAERSDKPNGGKLKAFVALHDAWVRRVQSAPLGRAGRVPQLPESAKRQQIRHGLLKWKFTRAQIDEAMTELGPRIEELPLEDRIRAALRLLPTPATISTR